MSTEAQVTDSARGYLSEESKRRFTLVAGILGGVFFLAQVLLPMIVVFLVMMPTMMVGREISTTEIDKAALWRGELWLIARTINLELARSRDLGHRSGAPARAADGPFGCRSSASPRRRRDRYRSRRCCPWATGSG